MQTSVIIETDHESSVPSSKTLSLWNVSNGTYETPCFSPSLLLQNLVMVVPHPLSATEWIILYFIDWRKPCIYSLFYRGSSVLGALSHKPFSYKFGY
ncbi:hypothetical protein NC653_019316 [Populus alba x Populus x berolinensis]|uniref:Uncharacterized protein n=1 Tax=Populus alba x Populus x berolinensis TaxID=444605 RepID=A0AAD6QIN8_9ROSI|nr:hypothetical protein NC653_019316 [Populus alba x Populus x berolinensis]